MRAFRLLPLLAFSLAVSQAASAEPSSVLSQWVQMAPDGVGEARAVVHGDSCPSADVDGASLPMRLRAPADQNFQVLLCALTLPANAKHVSVLGTDLPLPKPEPERIIVFGDTGCRIKGSTVQACNDPTKWQFPEIAAAAA